jgi:hypothetical protein
MIFPFLSPPQKVFMNPDFKAWKTIRLGTGLKTAEDFRHALKRGGYKVSARADDILGKPAFTAGETEAEVDLVVVSVAELGFKSGACRKDLYQRAQERGLLLCPAEVAPQLRLQYPDQPKGAALLIGMEPITDSVGGLVVFDLVGRGNWRWLRDNVGDPDNVWGGDTRFVFLRPRRPA